MDVSLYIIILLYLLFILPKIHSARFHTDQEYIEAYYNVLKSLHNGR